MAETTDLQTPGDQARPPDTPELVEPPEQEAPDEAALRRHAELSDVLNDARWRYHVLDAPTMSDG